MVQNMDSSQDVVVILDSSHINMCERLANTDNEHRPDAFFTVGLLSVLDALLDCPMTEVVRELSLSQEICDALVHRSGPLGTSLRAVIAYEQSDWERHALLRFYPERLLVSYLGSLGPIWD